ncbi:MAG: hypothetical protein DWI59_01430 [Chloroflexi bacterium]|nr:MAG: hypothetical protein DWI59_01430 [Chloroflexota bacterium]
MPPQDYREWMDSHGVERLDRVSSDIVPYFRLRAFCADGVYALTVLEPGSGGPTFDEALERLAKSIAAGPTSPDWMGRPHDAFRADARAAREARAARKAE